MRFTPLNWAWEMMVVKSCTDRARGLRELERLVFRAGSRERRASRCWDGQKYGLDGGGGGGVGNRSNGGAGGGARGECRVGLDCQTTVGVTDSGWEARGQD